MDKHKRLFDLLPEGARPKHSVMEGWNFRLGIGRGVTSEGQVYYASFTNPEDETAHALIEHAARLHYEGEGYEFKRGGAGRYFATFGGEWESEYLPLIDALLAAAEHAREGWKGE